MTKEERLKKIVDEWDKGRSFKEIAEELSLSYSTVSNIWRSHWVKQGIKRVRLICKINGEIVYTKPASLFRRYWTANEIIARRLRGSVKQMLKSTRTNKNNKTLKYVGCSKKELRDYIESKFTIGMSWDNQSEWNIDHIKPLTLFDLTKEEGVYKAIHFTNLQPLWEADNKSKGAKYKDII